VGGAIRDCCAAVIEIRGPAEVAFGYCSKHTNEIGWNAELRHVAKITSRPIGAGPGHCGRSPEFWCWLLAPVVLIVPRDLDAGPDAGLPLPHPGAPA
jgi:hypothetical protein